MGEGWENARRRGPGNDWAVFRLAARGEPTLLEVDTSYFIGNAPGQVRVSAADEQQGPVEDPASWWDLLPRTPVLPDTRHHFLVDVRRPATHLRLDVYPDGGLSRLRCFGELPEEVRKKLSERFWEVLPTEHQQFLIRHGNDPR
jgi:allantoicase